MNFPTKLVEIEERLKTIDPKNYAGTRNFKDGCVTYLSPYVSRGVLSTKQIYDHVRTLDLTAYQAEKFVQELAWRDYWQQVWIVKKEEIKQDLKYPQQSISKYGIPKAIIEANTGIIAVDEAIKELYASGYMHNHMRMYVASICCNVANVHWLAAAQWLYSLLLDGDLASNHLSWQWVAGTFSSKKYFANQSNINKYFNSDQQDTFLDIEYSEFADLGIPTILREIVSFETATVLPNMEKPTLDKYKKTLVYNYYNIDPYWHKDEDVQRIFLMEPSFYKKYPVSQQCIDFVLALTQNIDGIKIYITDFADLLTEIGAENLVYKEHPTNSHYKGLEEPRKWLSSVTGYYPSFFAFWKKCAKNLKSEIS
ncbi:deoxyribodipyrimidine photo-lyase [Pedobacter sp. UYEF25]